MSEPGQDHPAGPPAGTASDPSAPDPDQAHWFDDEAGPVVRPYAMTRGRTSTRASTVWT